MTSVPIRLRLTLVFVGVMAVVLAATGLFLYLRFADELDQGIDQTLGARTDDLSVRLREEGAPEAQGELAEEGLSFAQILDPRGRVLDGAPPLQEPVLTDEELSRASTAATTVERDFPASSAGEDSRLLARPVDADGQSFVVVAGASLEGRDDALEGLASLLLIGGPLSLLLASLAGYGVAAAALRPVDSMRQRAAAVSDSQLSRRLPVPPARDEIGRLGDTLNEMLDRLEAAFERERGFVSDASHELRTPLAILRAELDLALRRERSPAELESTIRSALEETDRLARLADDLLLLARSDEGRLAVRFEPIDVGEMLERIRERFAPRGSEAGRAIRVDVADGLVLEADQLRCEQALANLLDNSLRYGSGDISMSAREESGSIELHVADEGEGFEPGFLERAFQRFTRADEGRTSGGTGLGLAIVRAIARAHRGEAHAANRRPSGADVWLSIPKPAA